MFSCRRQKKVKVASCSQFKDSVFLYFMKAMTSILVMIGVVSCATHDSKTYKYEPASSLGEIVQSEAPFTIYDPKNAAASVRLLRNGQVFLDSSGDDCLSQSGEWKVSRDHLKVIAFYQCKDEGQDYGPIQHVEWLWQVSLNDEGQLLISGKEPKEGRYFIPASSKI